MQKVIFYLMLLIFSNGVIAQQYEQSAGVRLGHTSGLAFKKFVVEEEAIEFLLSGRKNGLQLMGMYVFHQPMEFSFNENFYAYYGVGGHLGYEQYGNLSKTLVSIEPPDFVFEDKSYFVMGIDAILGIEYRWLSVPITIAFDVKPYFSFIGMRHTNATFWDAAISVKYIF